MRRVLGLAAAVAVAAAGCGVAGDGLSAARSPGPAGRAPVSDDGAVTEGFEPLATADVTFDSLEVTLDTTSDAASGRYRVCATVSGAHGPWCLGPFTADGLAYEARMDTVDGGAVVMVVANPDIVAAHGLTRVELVRGVANGWVGLEPPGADRACFSLVEQGGRRIDVEVAATSETALHTAQCLAG